MLHFYITNNRYHDPQIHAKPITGVKKGIGGGMRKWMEELRKCPADYKCTSDNRLSSSFFLRRETSTVSPSDMIT